MFQEVFSLKAGGAENKKMIRKHLYLPQMCSNLAEFETRHDDDIEYLHKDTVILAVREYLQNWLDPYKIERLIDKIEEL